MKVVPLVWKGEYMLRETQFLWTRQFPLRIKSAGNELLLKDWGQEILDSKEGGKMRDTWSPLESGEVFISSQQTGMHVCSVALVMSLWDSMNCSPPGSSVHGILQARILEWVAMPSSRGSSQPRDWTRVSCAASRSLLLSHQGSPSTNIYWYKHEEGMILTSLGA